jgi:hypothetical protein
MARYILDDESCEECAGSLELNTKAEQPLFNWRAFDADELHCIECGLLHVVDAHEGMAYVNAVFD